MSSIPTADYWSCDDDWVVIQSFFGRLSTIHLAWMDGEGGKSAWSWCVICMGVICYQHGGDSISACSKEHRCTEQEIFLDGAKAGFPCWERSVCMLLSSWKYGVFWLKVWCFRVESMVFPGWKYGVYVWWIWHFFHRKINFSCNYPLNLK